MPNVTWDGADIGARKGEPMTEQGTDRYGAEYKRTGNDFHARYLEQDNGICSVCHGTGAKIEIRYVVRNYESARVKKKICKNLQAHERSLWICPKCIDNFKQKLSVINERNLAQPKPCPYCGGNAIRKQCHFKVGEGESRYKNEHHEDGSLKWTWLECDSCGRATQAYCYEYQSTDYWNKGKAERRTDEPDKQTD